jgi:uncharacterized tellurite resistance protein B-like protein
MNQPSFNELLLKTAFSCMASDGHIDPREIQLIISLEKEENLFGIKDIKESLNDLVNKINQNGHVFLRTYLLELSQSELSTEEQVTLIRTAIKTIKSDNEEHYSEIRFFKIIRSKLSVSDSVLIEQLSEFENLEEDYLVQDIISPSYLDKLSNDYFDNQEIPEFTTIQIDLGD